MYFDYLTIQQRRAKDNKKMINMYYFGDVQNEWCYEDEILHMNGYSIITTEKEME